jgi:hypothetical protein
LNSPVPEEPGPAPEESGGKRVSWVELYFDLIFAFAVGQTAHIMVADPHWGGLGRAVGLFVPLWWTWIGFVVLYNRHGEDHISQRLLLLVGTLPCAVAAVETHSAARGDLLAFTFALAGARLVLAAAFAFTAEGARPVSIGYGFSTAAFAASAFVPSPWRYLPPAFALLTMSAGVSLVLSGDSPQAAAWFITGGLAVYLVGTRVVLTSRLMRFEPQLRWAVAGATACLAFLAPLISAAGVVLVTTAWAAAVAAYETWRAPGRIKDILADPLTFFRRV